MEMRILRMTEANKKQVLKDVAAQLDGLVVIPDTLSVKLSTSKKPKSSPKIIFTDEAADKIWELVDACDKEIAWHGLVKKEKNTYTIYDILVFPQEVTASTATAKEEEYVMWMNELDDETFNHMRFHGHSHVNMGVTPSGVDTDYQETLANTVQDFYIFGIFNKKRSYNLYLYDMKQNVLFETKDLKTTLNDHTSTWADEQIEKYVTVYKTCPKYYGARVGNNYYERTEYPTCLLEDYKGNNEYCNYALYYDTKNKVKATLIDGKVIKVEKYEKPTLPFVFIHYCNPITGNSSQSVVDCLNSIQLQIDKVANKIKEAMDLNPAMSVFVPEGSTIKAGQLNNRVGNIFTYKPIPGMTTSPVTTATPPFIDNQYVNMLNDYIQKAYEMVGLTQLSAQGAKPIGIDSGVAIQTLENVESERFEVQLSNVINMFVEIAKTCIFVFDKDDDILPKDKNRCQVKWRDVVKESEKMFIQFSAGDKLGKDPATKAQVIMQWAQAGFIPSSRVASLMEIPDLESTYTLATNSLNAVMTVIDRCIEKDNFDIPDFIPFTLLKEEIVNAQLSLYACGKDGSNDEDIEKLNVLYEEVEKIEKEIEPEVEQDVVQDVNNTELTNNVDTDVNTELTNNIEEN